MNYDGVMTIAKIMARELNWNENSLRKETNEVKETLSSFNLR